MRIDLKYRKVCENPDCSNGIIHYDIDDRKTESIDCPDCSGKGFTDEVMVFEWTEVGIWCEFEREIYLRLTHLGIIIESGTGRNITSEINPQSLRLIEEKECPDCEKGRIWKIGFPLGNGFSYKGSSKCENCTDGKVEVKTSFTVFDKSQKEYDAEIKRKIINTTLFKNLEPVFYEYLNLKIKEDEAMKLFKDIIIRTQ